MPRLTKTQIEQSIMDHFLNAYAKQYNAQLQGVTPRDRPDFEAFDPVSNSRIGVEVTGVYQDSRQAMIQISAIENWDHFQESPNTLLLRLNERLADKAAKSKEYHFSGRLVLALWWGALVFQNRNDLDLIRSGIVLPENDFSDIWLIIRGEDGQAELYRVQ